MSVLLSLLRTLRTSAHSRAALQLEVLALRHQLQVLQRTRLRPTSWELRAIVGVRVDALEGGQNPRRCARHHRRVEGGGAGKELAGVTFAGRTPR